MAVARNWTIERRFFVALLVETAWEILENSPMIIDRYREATIAIGYTGDSVINSLSDIAMMAIGLRRRAPPAAVGIVAVACGCSS